MRLQPLKLLLSLGLILIQNHLKSQITNRSQPYSTTIPVTQNRDSTVYNWQERHNAVLALNKQRPPKIVFIGNSILHYWAGEPIAPIRRGEDSWNYFFKEKDVRNMGFGWDRIENALWRIQNGELDGFSASHIVLLIGTNNLAVNTDEEIVIGIQSLIQAIKQKQPKAKIVCLAILPRRNYEPRISVLNDKIQKSTKNLKIKYVNTGSMLLQSDQKINEALFSDGVHPNATGYNLLAPFINRQLK